MLWKRWWFLTVVTALVLGGVGIWAKGKLIGSEACTSPAGPAPCSAQATQPIPTGSKLTPYPAPTVTESMPDTRPVSMLPAPPPVTVTEEPPAPTPRPTAYPAFPAGAAPATDPSPTPVAPVAPTGTPVPSAPVAPVGSSTATPPLAQPVVPAPSSTGVEPTRYRIPEAAATPPAATPAGAVAVPCPWTLRVEIVKGRPQLEARIGKEVQFRIDCERLNLQAPEGTIVAQGSIKVSASDLEGVCDRLTINWQEDRLILEKEVRLKCHKEGQEVELTGERLTVKLTANGSDRASNAGNAAAIVKPTPTSEGGRSARGCAGSVTSRRRRVRSTRLMARRTRRAVLPNINPRARSASKAERLALASAAGSWVALFLRFILTSARGRPRRSRPPAPSADRSATRRFSPSIASRTAPAIPCCSGRCLPPAWCQMPAARHLHRRPGQPQHRHLQERSRRTAVRGRPLNALARPRQVGGRLPRPLVGVPDHGRLGGRGQVHAGHLAAPQADEVFRLLQRLLEPLRPAQKLGTAPLAAGSPPKITEPSRSSTNTPAACGGLAGACRGGADRTTSASGRRGRAAPGRPCS